MSFKNCETATGTIKFLGNDLSEGRSREKPNITKFLDNFKKQKAKKQVKQLKNLTQFCPKYIRNLVAKLEHFIGSCRRLQK